ncbi:uncharacterized protein TNCV_4430701 [Trichonephila clavipes]|nr:uncharacterized protein TNCV_4430701 [Trichonephila clavipes]
MLVFRPACLPCAASRKEENGVLGILCIPFGPRFSRMEETDGLGIPLRSLWPTLHCRRVSGVSPLLLIDWWYLSSVSLKRHCCRASVSDKGWRVYPLDPRPDAVALYSGCTPSKRVPGFWPDDWNTAFLVGLHRGWRHARVKSSSNLWIQICSARVKALYCPTSTLTNPVTISPHNTFNSCRGVISETDLLSTPEAEILEGFSNQGVIQVIRIPIKKDSTRIQTKHLILTFNSPILQTNIKAGYLNCRIHPYIPNPLRCFKCQRFGHSQTSCRSQLTCCIYASVGHSSMDCTLEPKCVNCTQSHPSDPKLCPKWKLEKQIQEIKTNKNISYFEARKLIVPQLTQTYAQATKPSSISTTTQTDPNITNIICSPLQCLKPVSSANPMPSTSSSVTTVSTSSSSTQAHLLPSTSAIIPSILKIETRPLTTSSKFAALSTEIQPLVPLPESVSTTSNSEHSNAPEIPKCVKRNSRNRRKSPKVQKPEIEIKIAPHRPRKSAPTDNATDEEDMIFYDVEDGLEPNPADKFVMGQHWRNNPDQYLHAVTPTRFRKSRN